MIDKTARRPVHTRKSRFYVQYSSHESVSTTCKISSEHWAVAVAAARAEDENFTIDTVLPAGSMIINNSIQDRKAISEQQIAETFNGLHRSLLCSKNILWLRFSPLLSNCVFYGWWFEHETSSCWSWMWWSTSMSMTKVESKTNGEDDMVLVESEIRA